MAGRACLTVPAGGYLLSALQGLAYHERLAVGRRAWPHDVMAKKGDVYGEAAACLKKRAVDTTINSVRKPPFSSHASARCGGTMRQYRFLRPASTNTAVSCTLLT